MSGEAFKGQNFRCFLELGRRNDVGTGHINRIPLFVDNISISTGKMVMNAPVPFSGAIRGESLNLAFDIGQASKNISLSGTLMGMGIKKQKDADSLRTVNLTSFEVAQLIHSYVDSSTFQDDQNMNKLIILIPSRVNENFHYHNGSAAMADKDISELPLIPFTWKNRGYDNDFASLGANAKYFTPFTTNESDETIDGTVGLSGFIRSFSTNISGAEFPNVSFSLEFEEAMVLADNFLDG
tara:strand:- start:450 stop:1166 length:717 start_codon:yes stop_codon:yes gene_type:complete